MVDGYLLATDIVETSVYLATPPLLWMALFLVAWGDEATARESGFGRRTFWLLLPGALLGSFSDLPFFGWIRDVLAINIGGGLIPLVVSVLLVGRLLGRRSELLAIFAIAFAVESYFALAAVLLLPDGTLLDVVVAGVALAAVATLGALSRIPTDPAERATALQATYLLGLSSLALVPTFFSTSTVPGLGITSAFPWYLLPPIAVGALAVLGAGPLFGVSRRAGLGLGYAAATFGVLIGADLLREPPLYGGSTAGLYAIGGAGTGDLLYLSGLLALVAGLVVLKLVAPGPATAAPTASLADDGSYPLTPAALLRRSLVSAVEGRTRASVEDAHAAAEGALGEAHLLLAAEQGDRAGDRDLRLATATWMEADRTNLAALALSPRLDPVDATRAWMTARWIVRFARTATRRCFASLQSRGIAFLLDLTLLTAPALVVWYLLIAGMSGSVADLLSSVPVNVALFGYTSFGLVYFVLAEGYYSTTFGKWLVGLRVRARGLRPPGPVAVLLRNLPKLATLTIVGVFAILGLVFALRGASVGVTLPGGIDVTVNAGVTVLGYLATALAVSAGVSGLAMHYTPERQRLGDLLADTWVVHAPATAGAEVPPGASGPAPFA